ncbi:hypothetical protein [Proteiniphilum sp. UBA5384]|uniref:hypothetical protein n=1 Tax=Proteiniphilum sp. UBA5384 TaxID=1947279 RepID=UPI0025D18EEC|nr:hypothetical protein [Proteiniphilum sp. UBA5384]
MRVLHIVYFFLASAHLCLGSMHDDHPPGTKLVTAKSDFLQDSLYLRKGKDCIERLDYDSARVYLLQSANSTDIPVRIESYLYLNFIEIRLENYDIALNYLELYHKNAMLLFQRSIEIEDSVRNQKDNIDNIFSSIRRQNKVRLFFVILSSLILLIVIVFLFYISQKRVSVYSTRKKKELEKLNSTIQTKKKLHKSLAYNSYLLQAEIFKQIPIYTEIKELECQDRSKNVRVLTYEKQDHLQRELDIHFANFQRDLCTIHAKLTQNDLKLCCLSLLPLNSFAKALCFGSTEVNVIKQRKYYIKKKMTEDSDNILLFDFIFSARKE